MANLTLPIRLDPASPPDETLYTTTSGLPVLIYNVNGGGDRPIHGAIYFNNEWLPQAWPPSGKYEMCPLEHDFDLRDRAPAKRGAWVAWLEDPNGLRYFRPYATEHEALFDPQDDGALIALHYLEEGDGLDTPADPPLWVDWAKLPEWAEWAAATEKGLVRYYARRPNRGEGTWMTESSCVALASHLYRLAPGFDWRETLIQRPEGV